MLAILILSLLASGSLAIWEKVSYSVKSEDEIAQLNQLMMRDILLSQMDVAPLDTGALAEVPLDVLAFMYHHRKSSVVMLNAYLSYARYPKQTVAVMKEYGHVDLLGEILARHGSYKPIPVIHFAMTVPEAWDGWMDRADVVLDDLFNEGALAGIPAERRLVLKVMAKLASPVHGNGYLGRFLIHEDGHVERHWTKSIVNVTEGFFTGSISEIEYRVNIGAAEDLTWIDWGSGAMEVAVIGGVFFKAIAGVTHSIGKGAQTAKHAGKVAGLADDAVKLGGKGAASFADDVVEEGAKATSKSAKLVSGIGQANQVLFKYFPKSLFMKTAGVGFAGITAYIILKHPGHTYQYLGVVAEMLGVDPTLFRAGCFFLALMVVMNGLIIISLYISPVLAVVGFLYRIAAKIVSPIFRLIFRADPA